MRLLWCCDYWDGPLSGICLFNGRKHWFQIKPESVSEDDDEHREFDILYLTDDEIKAEDARHALWTMHVGYHCDYDDKNKRTFGDLKPQKEWDKFYSLPTLERNYKTCVKVVSEEELRRVECAQN